MSVIDGEKKKSSLISVELLNFRPANKKADVALNSVETQYFFNVFFFSRVNDEYKNIANRCEEVRFKRADSKKNVYVHKIIGLRANFQRLADLTVSNIQSITNINGIIYVDSARLVRAALKMKRIY